jgi:PPOX class probable F420-dependent enzyme
VTDENDRDAALHALIEGQNIGTLATLKRDGRAQLSNVSYTYDSAAAAIRISTRDMLAKAANIRRDPRVTLLASKSHGWSYAVAEGTATLSAVATDQHDDTVEELIEVYRAIGGEHPDWDDYRRAMVADRRLVLRIAVERVYGLVRG